MVETDAPFLLPRDLKGVNGRRNEPAYLPHIAASVARFAGRTEATVRQETTATAFRLFKLASRFGTSPRAEIGSRSVTEKAEASPYIDGLNRNEP